MACFPSLDFFFIRWFVLFSLLVWLWLGSCAENYLIRFNKKFWFGVKYILEFHQITFKFGQFPHQWHFLNHSWVASSPANVYIYKAIFIKQNLCWKQSRTWDIGGGTYKFLINAFIWLGKVMLCLLYPWLLPFHFYTLCINCIPLNLQ